MNTHSIKKTVVAGLIAAAFAGAASAQSNLVLYGIVDVGVQWNEFGVNQGTSSAPNFVQESNWGVESGYQSGSRFGFTGVLTPTDPALRLWLRAFL